MAAGASSPQIALTEVRWSLRRLWRAPVSTAVAVSLLAATAAVAALAATLLVAITRSPTGIPTPERVAVFPGVPFVAGTMTPDEGALKAHPAVRAAAAYFTGPVNLGGAGFPAEVGAAQVSTSGWPAWRSPSWAGAR